MHCGKQLSLTSGMDVHIFSTRTGTKQGVESHTFRVETQRDQTMWSKGLVNGAHQAAQIIQQVNCGMYVSSLSSQTTNQGSESYWRPLCSIVSDLESDSEHLE